MMTEVFEELWDIGDIMEDRVIYPMGSLPDSFHILMTALEANAKVARWEMVSERLFYKEIKIKQKEVNSNESYDNTLYK